VTDDLQSAIEAAATTPDGWRTDEAREAVRATLSLLDAGTVRVAEKDPATGDWRVNAWTKTAIVLFFRQAEMTSYEVGPYEYHDKVPLKTGYAEQGVRVVPPAVARWSAHLEPGVVMMPSYVNVGAYVGSGTMVDTWATVGSCAQIGRDVHLAGGVGIGGVLEPAGARPVIIEDGCFIGSRAVVVEGAHLEAGAVIGPNTVITASTPIIDMTGDEPVEYRGRVPANAVVVPGTRTKQLPAGTVQLGCAYIIGTRTESTDEKTALNDALREFGVGV
jgi:2,3,4,5-tetrahydropyridine-2,6-dicarboxylate N-succinyltransferase